MRPEVMQGLLSRLDGLFNHRHAESFSEAGGKAFAVIQYQAEGLSEVLRHLIEGNQVSANEAMQAWVDGQDLPLFKPWAVGLVNDLEKNFRHHWSGRVTRGDRDRCRQWFADARKLIDDVARV
jgi:hypothetical protein